MLGTEALLKLANRTSIQRTLACEQTLWGGRPYSRSSNLAWMRRWARENAMVARGRREKNYYPSRSCVSEFPLYHAVSKQANSYSFESSFMVSIRLNQLLRESCSFRLRLMDRCYPTYRTNSFARFHARHAWGPDKRAKDTSDARASVKEGSIRTPKLTVHSSVFLCKKRKKSRGLNNGYLLTSLIISSLTTRFTSSLAKWIDRSEGPVNK